MYTLKHDVHKHVSQDWAKKYLKANFLMVLWTEGVSLFLMEQMDDLMAELLTDTGPHFE